MLKSKATRMLRVSVKLSVKDDANKNVNFPSTALTETVFGSEDKHAFVFLKTDPSKDHWGDISLEVNAEPANTSVITSTSSYTGTYANYGTTTSSYSNYNVSSSVGTDPQERSYVPSSWGEDPKVSCANCGHLCDVGQDFCEKCGEPVTGYSGDMGF